MNSGDLISLTKAELVEAIKLWVEDFRDHPEEYEGNNSNDYLSTQEYAVGAANMLIDNILIVQQGKGE